MNLGAMGWKWQQKDKKCAFCRRTFSTAQGFGGHQKDLKWKKEALRRKYMGSPSLKSLELSLVIPNVVYVNEWIFASEANRSNNIFKSCDSSDDVKAVAAGMKEIKTEPESMECSESVSEELDLTLRL
ncbi:hypothetical protein BVC80_8945g13 [Macleaya cordata]|uniref:Zinc finger protein n=1 Tax=Macleaya cordata TaxID=56857 RepID=A0A200QRH4_MACCD|nr:hypothetical protein BVC80_8945g13 [Macleaya cordata]